MTTYKATGKVVTVGEIVTFESGFTKRTFVVDVSDGKYKSEVEFTLKKERTAKADVIGVGDTVEVEFTLDGRAWQGQNGIKYFTTLTAWEVVRTATEEKSAEAAKNAAVAAWKKFHGEDLKTFGTFCKSMNPGKAWKDYTAADWEAITAKVNADGDGSSDADFDDLPF